MTTAQTLAPIGVRSPCNVAKQKTIGQSKWDILKTVEDIRVPLGLKGTSIALLRAMISFLRVDRIEAVRDDAHICFASNAALAKRAHVSVQTVERHITKLVSLGLLSRRSSANGKRWARRDRQGAVVYATGLSLMPLVERHREFLTMAHKYLDQQTQLTVLRDKCSVALMKLKEIFGEDGQETLLAKARNLLRRQPKQEPLEQLLEEITFTITAITGSETDNLTATDNADEGHKETNKIQFVKNRQIEIDVTQAEMQHAFPKLCAELTYARSQSDCERIMTDLACYLKLRDIWHDLTEQGPAIRFMVLGYLLERMDSISNHRGYAMSITKKLGEGDMDWRSLLKRPTQQNRTFSAKTAIDGPSQRSPRSSLQV